jgi:hypothetical protein
MKKIFFLFIAVQVFISCEDFLEVEPLLQVSFAEQLSTDQGVQEIVSGIYRDVEGYQSSILFLYPDVMGGNITFSPNVSNSEINVTAPFLNSYSFNEVPTDSDFESTYDQLYDVINQVNLLLENIDGLGFYESAKKDQLRAEMLVIRALSHYHVYLLYAQNYNFTAAATHLGIVYNTRTLTAGEDFPGRETAAATYQLLQQDLDEALTLFNEASFLGNGVSFSYFNEVNTRALYARIALQMNDWQKALDLSENVINTSGVLLTPSTSIVDQWLDTAVLSETLMQLSAPTNNDDGEITVSSSISEYYLYNSPTDYGSYVASRDLVDLFEAGDLRLNLFQTVSIATRENDDLVPSDYLFNRKYQEDSSIAFIRLSEMYLISAEAQERLSPGSIQALDRLNSIRERAGTPPLLSSTNLLEEIFMERRREFAFESHLFYDLKRFNKDVERNQGCISSLCNLSYPSPFFVLPIPQISVSINENMVQNEGY